MNMHVFTIDELKTLKPIQLASIRIEQTKLSNQTRHILFQAGILYLGQLNRITEQNMFAIKDMGISGWKEIQEFLRQLKN